VSRGLLAAVVFTLVLGATAAARTGGQAARPRTLGVTRRGIVGLAQEGRWFAWIRNRGTPLEVGTFPSRRQVSLPASTAQSGCWRCSLLNVVAVGTGGRVLWQEVTDGGNTYLVVSVKTASPRTPRALTLASTYMADDEGDPDWIDPESRGRGLPMAADGKAMLFYASCEGGELCYPDRIRSGIYRVAGRRRKFLAKAKDPVALAVAGRRFALVTNSARCCSFIPTWSHDGKRIAWIYRRDLWTVRSEGTDDRKVASDLLPSYWESGVAGRPSWSPDDARLVFERVGRDKEHPERVRSLGIFSVDAGGHRVRRLASGTAPAWSPDGTRIAFVRGSQVFSIAPDGTAERRLTSAARATAPPLSWAPDSARIAVSRGGDIYSVRADGGGETRLTTSRRRETEPAWSPDGSRIAYVDGSAIAVANSDGSGAKRLTKEEDGSPAWSPDSKSIAFIRDADPWLMSADGSGRRRLLRNTYSMSLQWSPGPAIVVGDRYPESSGYSSHPGVVVVPPIGKAKKVAPVPHSGVEVRDALTGRLIKRFTISGHAQTVSLGRGYVAVLVDHEPGLRVELYGLNGRFRVAVAVPPSTRQLSASGRDVVFVTGHRIRRLNAMTRAVTTLVTTTRIPVEVSVERRRVVWAENARMGTKILVVTAP
jgi:Tol biopolymer transport system component